MPPCGKIHYLVCFLSCCFQCTYTTVKISLMTWRNKNHSFISFTLMTYTLSKLEKFKWTPGVSTSLLVLMAPLSTELESIIIMHKCFLYHLGVTWYMKFKNDPYIVFASRSNSCHGIVSQVSFILLPWHLIPLGCSKRVMYSQISGFEVMLTPSTPLPPSINISICVGKSSTSPINGMEIVM